MANRYWVGGTATWDGTAGSKWAATDGGAGGASVPTAADDVFITAKPAPTWQASTAYTLTTSLVTPVTGNGYHYQCTTAGTSGTVEPTWPTVVGNTVTDGTVVWTCRLATVTTNTGVSQNTNAKSIDCTGFIGTFVHGGTNCTVTVAGSVTLNSTMTFTRGGGASDYFIFTGTGNLTSAGKTFSSVRVNGSGITLTLSDALNVGGVGIVDVQQGTFTTSNFNVTTSLFSSNYSNTRTINLGSSTVSITSATPIDFTTTTNLTLNAGTSTINCSSTTATFNGNGLTYYNVGFTATAIGTRSLTGANTFNNLSLTVSTTGLTQLALSANQTVNGTFTCAGSSVIARGFIRSNTAGTSRTITAATLSATDCDFRDITIAGAAAGSTPTRAGDCGGNSGITFSSKTVYWNLAGTNDWNATGWALTNNGTPAANNFPLAQDTATFTNSGSAGTVNFGSTAYNFPAIDASGRTSAMTLGHNGAQTLYGSYTLGSGVTVSGTSSQTFSGRGTMTVTSAGKTLTFAVVIDTPSGTFQLGDAFNTNDVFTLTRGTLSAVTYNVTCLRFNSANGNIRTINMGSGLWTMTTGTSVTAWDLSVVTNLTFNKDTANILFSSTASSITRTFAGGGQTYNTFTIGGATGTSTATSITGTNTFGEIASTKTVAHTITFAANQTIGTWSITGTAGNIVTLNSSVAGTARTLTKSGGGFLTGIDYLNVRDVVGSPQSDTWYIGPNSVYNTSAPNTAQFLFLTQRATNAVIVLDSTVSATWTVPADWNNSNNAIHLIGGGGGGAGSRASGNNRAGGGGGGGGGYTRLTNQTLTPGAGITYQCGSGGTLGSAGANGGAGGTTSWNSGAATAGGGGGGQATTTPTSTGGTAGVGSTFNGGVGGAGSTSTAASTAGGGGGGAGAGGPNGNGANGGTGFAGSTTSAGGGGGGNGGGSNGGNAAASTGGAGGNNAAGAGSGGAVGGGGNGTAGGAINNGGNGVDILGAGGGGGGGGGNTATNPRTGGLYGGGGGGGGHTAGGVTAAGVAGAQGAIIIVYGPGTPAPTATGNMFFMFY